MPDFLRQSPQAGLLSIDSASACLIGVQANSKFAEALTLSGLTMTPGAGANPGTLSVNAPSGLTTWIDWTAAGVAPPALNSTSAGTKLLLYPELSVSNTNFAIGIESATLWFSVPTVSRYFRYYFGNIEHSELSADASRHTNLRIGTGGNGNSRDARLELWSGSSGVPYISFHKSFNSTLDLRYDSNNELVLGGSSWAVNRFRWRADGWNGITTGIYALQGDNGAEFRWNAGTYGAWSVQGTRNGWRGLEFIGTFATTTSLMVNDDEYGFHRNGTGWRMYVATGSLYVPGNLVAYWSDRRLKRNFRDISSEELWNTLGAMRAKRFEWNEKVMELGLPVVEGQEEVGLIAQDVESVLPDGVVINKTQLSPDYLLAGPQLPQKDFKTIAWNKVIPWMVEALNNLNERLSALEQR